MAKMYIILTILLMATIFSGCGASPEWKAAGIQESETENYWKRYGVYSPTAAKTYMSCGIKGHEVGRDQNIPVYWQNNIKYGHFSSPEHACIWKEWCSNCNTETMFNLDDAGIQPSDKTAADWYKLANDSTFNIYFSKDINKATFIRTVRALGLTPNELKKYVKEFYGSSSHDNLKLLVAWKDSGFSLEDVLLNKNNCKSSFDSCYGKSSPTKTKELMEIYGFDFYDAIFVQKTNQNPEQLQLLSKELNISLPLANTYLTYFNYSDAKQVYKQTKSVNDADIKLLSEYMKKGQSIVQAQKSIKDYEEQISKIIYRNNYDTETCEVSKFNTKLKSELQEFKCHESILGGYDRCKAEFKIDLSSSCEKSFSAKVKCTAKVEYRVQDSYLPSQAEESNSETIYVKHGYGSRDLTIDSINVSSITGKTYRAKISDSECKIDYIRE